MTPLPALPAADRPLPRARWLRLLLLGAAGFFALTTVTGVRTSIPAIALADRWLSDAFALGAGASCLLRAWLVREERRAWAVLGLGLASYGAGTVYFHAVVVHQQPQPFPSLADAGWLAFYPAAYAAAVLLLRARLLRFHPSVWLDGLIGASGAAMFGAAFAFEAIVRATSGSAAVVAVTLAYPIADLVLLVLVVGAFGLLGWRPGRAWWLLGLGLAAFAAADTTYMFEAVTGAYHFGMPIDVVWAAALVTLGLAAWQRPRHDARVRFDGIRVLAVPTTFTLCAVGLLAFASAHHVSRVAVALATATVLAAVVRTVLTFVEVQRLAASRQQARTDDLTGLANRRAFWERLEHAIAAGARPAVLAVDLDRFKEVNDSLGHQVGDELLRLVGARLAGELRDGEVLARLGGDEFAVLLQGAGLDGAARVAARLRACLLTPFEVGGVTLHADASVGIALCPDHADGISELLRCADVAMYAAKAARTGVEPYRPETDLHSRERRELVEALREALHNEELVLHYQPKVDLHSGAVAGVEALVRWQHPARGLLYPDAFIELAEQSGLIRALTLTVLRLGLRQCRAWWDAGVRLSVAVNLSPSNLLDSELPARVAELLASFGLPPSALELEITETVLMLDRIRSVAALNALRQLGVRIAVDDFGTGYSSLAYLRELPVDELKLDKSFVLHLDRDPLAAAIVRSTVGLAHSLGLRMVAEGVESADSLRKLQAYGCDVAQGYYLSRPQPPGELLGWLQRALRMPVCEPQEATVDAAAVDAAAVDAAGRGGA